ncbi:PadR family transcriptional regulator [Bacillus sp. M6-12]|uniref:PadR family transcriptional regulator n=1 Tax=Bacillus sp. M6-12 TaxID=2054166 RepID=UPI000C75E91E|nr:PadR family transcriptional regulator [Bacillus sp. M6-12]PLS18268.1 PadR family transcriptional regulator [Bacillus sp. M6-12]
MNSNDWITQVRRGILEFCVLTIVNEKPSYGYDLVTTLSSWEQLAAKEGTLYPLLRRLQKDELIDSFWQESESGPPRKYYQITEQGKELLTVMESEWGKLTRAITELKQIKGEDFNGEHGNSLFK